MGRNAELMVSKTIIILLFFVSLTQGLTGDHKRVDKRNDYVVSNSVKKLMKKHGIQVMYQDWNDKWWFKRDGKKIFLEAQDD